MRRGRQDAKASGDGKPLERLEAMMRDGTGLRQLQAQLPPGATLEDARRARERILQLGRQPSHLLDDALGIARA
jgi:hypothetical protein